MQLSSAPHEDDLIAAMRQFIVDQAEGRTDETVRRYAQVADDLAATRLNPVRVTVWREPDYDGGYGGGW